MAEVFFRDGTTVGFILGSILVVIALYGMLKK